MSKSKLQDVWVKKSNKQLRRKEGAGEIGEAISVVEHTAYVHIMYDGRQEKTRETKRA